MNTLLQQAACEHCGQPVGFLRTFRKRRFCSDDHERQHTALFAQMSMQRLAEATRAAGPAVSAELLEEGLAELLQVALVDPALSAVEETVSQVVGLL